MTISDQETRSESALGSWVDDTSSEVKSCDRASDQIWYCIRMIYVHRTSLSEIDIETYEKEVNKMILNVMIRYYC